MLFEEIFVCKTNRVIAAMKKNNSLYRFLLYVIRPFFYRIILYVTGRVYDTEGFLH